MGGDGCAGPQSPFRPIRLADSLQAVLALIFGTWPPNRGPPQITSRDLVLFISAITATLPVICNATRISPPRNG